MHFLDSFKFMSTLLDKLIKNISDYNKLFLKSLATNENEFQLMNKKGYFPYEWFDSIDKLKLPITELKKRRFQQSFKIRGIK